MWLDSYFLKRQVQSISLHEASQKLGIPQGQIVSLLSQSGFPVLNAPFTRLDSYHLNLLATAYVKSVKALYKRVSKNYMNFDRKTQQEWRHFFSRFIDRGFPLWTFTLSDDDNLEKVFNSSLDENLIKSFFWELLVEVNSSEICQVRYVAKNESNDLLKKYRYKVKFKVKPKFKFNDFRTKIFSFLLSRNYYKFSDDEDNSRKYIKEMCFSGINNISREALKFINYLKFHLQWKIYNHSLRT